jgi:hypothetical protein
MAATAMERRWQSLQTKALESYVQEHVVTVYDGIGWGWLLLFILPLAAGVFLHLKYRHGQRKPPEQIRKLMTVFAAGTSARLALGAAFVIVAALIAMTDRYEAHHMKTLKRDGVRVTCEITGFVTSGVFFSEPLAFFVKRDGGGAMLRDTHGITALDGLSLAKGDKAELLYLKDDPETARIDRGIFDRLQSVFRWFLIGVLLGLVRLLFPKKDRPPGLAGPEERRGKRQTP